jgi:hypothetical protein
MPSQTPNYRFSGGNGPNPGDVRNDVGTGAAPVIITLSPLAGYSIRDMSDNPNGVQLAGDGTDQMVPTVSGSNVARIDNSCARGANVEYTINVRAPSGTNIACPPG